MIETEIGQQLEDVIDELVSSGRYRSKNDVLREGVRLVKEQEARLATVDAALARGVADADAGRSRSVSDVFEGLTTKIEKAARASR